MADTQLENQDEQVGESMDGRDESLEGNGPVLPDEGAEADRQESLQEDSPSEGGEKGAGKVSFLKKIFGSKKRLILILGILVLLILLAAGVWLFFFSGSDAENEDMDTVPTQEEALAQEEWKTQPVAEDVILLAPFERIVMKPGSAKGFVNMDIALLLTDPADRVDVFSRMDEIRRLIQDNIREKTWMELRSPQGKIQSKYEMLTAINGLFPKRVLKDLYMTNFIML